jgi:energy-coupling factor transporter ATP-binding protein EcfA2
MTWSIETLNATVDEEIKALPVDIRVRLVRIAELITTVGLKNVREPHIKHYVTARKKRVVIVRVFIKKTEKIPRSEIEIALTRAKEVQND